MNDFVVVTFYQFTSLDNFQEIKEPLLSAMKSHDIKGTIILASEGMNGTFCGQRDNVDALMAFIKQFPGLSAIQFRETYHDSNPFAKAKVKIRPEIVTMGVEQVNPLEKTGVHLDAEDWNALLDDPNAIVIDTRNDYEVQLGTFEGASNPVTMNFRDFPEYVKTHLSDKKDKKIGMFCTGGVRCEKSTAYLLQAGFQEVYQLNGGILTYLASMPKDKSKWKGTCFVFDDRVALDHELQAMQEGTIDLEWKNKHRLSMLEKQE